MNRNNATGRREAAQPKRDRYSAQRSDKPFEAEGPVDTPEAKEKPKAAPEQKHKKAGKAGKGHVTGGTGLMDILTAQREQ